MLELEQIKSLVDADNLAEALKQLNAYIAEHADDDSAYFMRGKVYWRIGQRAQAITDYERATQLNPLSPARHALNQSRDIMDFFNPDIYNP
jgi:Flp pilus assembly protein TadD